MPTCEVGEGLYDKERGDEGKSDIMKVPAQFFSQSVNILTGLLIPKRVGSNKPMILVVCTEVF